MYGLHCHTVMKILTYKLNIMLDSLPGIKLFDLSKKTAIVTGGSKGLGLAMAAGLASAGANLLIVNRNEKDGFIIAEKIAKTYGVKALAFAADISKEEQTDAMAAFAMENFGSIDILINSAGINIRGAIDEVSLEDFNKVMEVNVTGSWLCSRSVIPHMKAQKSGKIINLASTLGQMTRALGIELAPFDIKVNAICPGPFLTEMNIPVADDPATKEFIIGATALGRWGELKEIQGAAIFLASEAANYMTGSLLTVDGGWTAK